jgi:hypothetical protein
MNGGTNSALRASRQAWHVVMQCMDHGQLHTASWSEFFCIATKHRQSINACLPAAMAGTSTAPTVVHTNAAAEPKAKEMCKVLLSNLPQGLSKAELLHTLGQLGEVVEVHITGEAPGQVGSTQAVHKQFCDLHLTWQRV